MFRLSGGLSAFCSSPQPIDSRHIRDLAEFMAYHKAVKISISSAKDGFQIMTLSLNVTILKTFTLLSKLLTDLAHWAKTNDFFTVQSTFNRKERIRPFWIHMSIFF